MKIGIMQPYIFPYVGYFQLVHAVDKFVLLDDVNFIKRGWINRNRILVNGNDYLFSIPVKNASQNRLILDCEFSDEPWQDKFLKTIEFNYKKAPFANDVIPLIERIVNFADRRISPFVYNHLNQIFGYLDFKKEIIPSSAVYNTGDFKAQDKILEICKKEHATHYINPIGGVELYDSSKFKNENIQLSFIKSGEVVYGQGSGEFVPWLSIIDVLMFNSKSQIVEFLNRYTLVSNE
ncbi:MAG: WbqC family protein [Fibrobacteres bacterium]|nr:WbqC family protein [Fibrobacterota bacterium]